MSQWEVFAGQVIVVTGAASGFGRILATKLNAVGARLALADINADALENLAAELASSGNVLTQTCDVSRESQVADFIAAAVARFGRLDIVVNNAGLGSPPRPIIEITEDDMDINFNVNTKGVLWGMKYGIRQMLAQTPQGGTVLNVASMAGLGAAPNLGAYVAAKHGVVGLTKTAAWEYGGKGVRVNAICPFFSPTPLLSELELSVSQENLARGTPMKRLGAPEEMVDVMMTLISPSTSFVNGQAVAVDGGMSAM